MEHGFRLPSALDNRPLRFEEFVARVPQASSSGPRPGPFELEHCRPVVEQVIRPTGLVDPEVVIQPTKGQVDDLMARIDEAVPPGGRVLVTTLTKKMAEDLTDYLADAGRAGPVPALGHRHHQRMEILREPAAGRHRLLVGINLLREGLDLPEVSLVAILDADKEGFLRSASALIQTMGRAARNVDGRVVLYADTITDSMREAVSITQRRREVQTAYNAEHGIDPQTIRKAVTDILQRLRGSGDGSGRAKRSRADVRGGKAGRIVRTRAAVGGGGWAPDDEPPAEVAQLIEQLEEEMKAAAAELRFEEAALLRDEMVELRLAASGGAEAPTTEEGGESVRDRSGRSPAGWVVTSGRRPGFFLVMRRVTRPSPSLGRRVEQAPPCRPILGAFYEHHRRRRLRIRVGQYQPSVLFGDTEVLSEGTVVDAVAAHAAHPPGRPRPVRPTGPPSPTPSCGSDASRLAGALREAGVGRGDQVAIWATRSVPVVAAALAAMALGAAYVPIDPTYPAARVRRILEVGRAPGDRLRRRPAPWPGACPGACPRWTSTPEPARPPVTNPAARPTDVAYTVFTTGSTGLPKGVLVSHRSLLNYLGWARELTDFGPDDATPCFASLGFDHAVTCLWLPLVEPAGRCSSSPTAGTPARGWPPATRPFAFIKITPSHVRLFERIARPDYRSVTRTVMFGGERLDAALVAGLGDRVEGGPPAQPLRSDRGHGGLHGLPLRRRHRASADGAVPIGRPVWNSRAYVVDADLRPVPVGEEGELVLAGDCVADGYLGGGGEDRARFVDESVLGATTGRARAYRTGDRCVLATARSTTAAGWTSR